jgi:hypothetical protein
MMSMGSLNILGVCGQDAPQASIDSSSLQGIWSFNLNGTTQATASLHQQGNLIFGSAKSESANPWNAVIMGDISGKGLELSMISLKDKSITSLRLMGNVHNESIRGTLIGTDDWGNTESGVFTAVLVNPDTSAYVPANASSERAAPVNASTQPTPPASQATPEWQYRDVHSLAGTVPESLGVGFIGDGTMGTGGMGMG